MPDEETVADRLRTAAAYVGDNHTRGSLVDEHGRTCAVGAILGLKCVDQIRGANVLGMSLLAADRTAYAAVTALASYLRPEFPRGYEVGVVETWNDSDARDGAEVAAAMEKAAAQWEETHG